MTRPDEDLEALRDATRFAHETIQELRDVIKEAKHWQKVLQEAAQTEVESVLFPEVKRQVEALGNVTKEAMDASVEKVTAEFDKLGAMLLEPSKRDRRRGALSLSEMIEGKIGAQDS